jgi:hypothetical protein
VRTRTEEEEKRHTSNHRILISRERQQTQFLDHHRVEEGIRILCQKAE